MTTPVEITVEIRRLEWERFVATHGTLDNALTQIQMHLNSIIGIGATKC